MLSRTARPLYRCSICRYHFLHQSASIHTSSHQRSGRDTRPLTGDDLTRDPVTDSSFLSKFENVRDLRRPDGKSHDSNWSKPHRQRRESGTAREHKIETEDTKPENRAAERLSTHAVTPQADGASSYSNPQEQIEIEHRPSYLDLESTREPSPFEGASASLEHPGGAPRLKNKGFKHHILQQAHVKIDALGQPVNALVIRNPDDLSAKAKRKASVRELKEEVPSGLGPTVEDLIGHKDNDDDNLMDQAYRNIEELRPRDTGALIRSEFEKLVAQVVQGFTQAQIAFYISRQKSLMGDVEVVKFDWVENVGRWEAESPLDWGILKPKQKQALIVVQQIWGLEVLEHIEAIGKLPIWVKEPALHLLAYPANSALNNIRRGFLDESKHENISLHLEQSAMLIQCSKPTAEHVLSQVDLVLQNLRSRTVSVEQIEPKDLNPRTLEALGSATQTHIMYSQASQNIEVHWLSDPDDASGASTGVDASNRTVEDKADLVLRLLLRPPCHEAEHGLQIPIPREKSEKKTLKSTKASKSTSPLGQFIPYHREKRSMSWRDKLESWARYITPISKGESQISTYDFEKQSYLTLPTKNTLGSNSMTQLTATFGQILHLENSVAKKSASKKTKFVGRRIISPVIPHPASFTALASDPSIELSRCVELVLNFRPDARLHQGGKAAPEMRVHLPITATVDSKNSVIPSGSKLYCLVPPQLVDVLLPAEDVDVRLTKTRQIPLQIEKQEGLRSFLSATRLNVAGRPRCPSHISFAIPSDVLTVGSDGKGNSNVEKVSQIRYAFTNLEIHQLVRIPRGSIDVVYSSIEATDHGGQRQEISVQYSIPGSQSKIASKKPVAKFYELVERIAKGGEFSWSGGASQMQESTRQNIDIEMDDDGSDFASTNLEGSSSESIASDELSTDPKTFEEEDEKQGLETHRDGEIAEEDRLAGPDLGTHDLGRMISKVDSDSSKVEDTGEPRPINSNVAPIAEEASSPPIQQELLTEYSSSATAQENFTPANPMLAIHESQDAIYQPQQIIDDSLQTRKAISPELVGNAEETVSSSQEPARRSGENGKKDDVDDWSSPWAMMKRLKG